MKRAEEVVDCISEKSFCAGVLGAEGDEALAGQPTLQAAGELCVDGPNPVVFYLRSLPQQSDHPNGRGTLTVEYNPGART